jgi:glycerol-3-phosphate dehydrogenase
MQDFSTSTRAAALQTLKEGGTLDLLVIGGGITGVAAARDAARRGLAVGLIERGDYACGTSSRSSKLVHGGLRYLENFDFGLVHEGCQERRLLLDRDPTHVEPLEFVYPVYAGDKAGYYQVKAGMLLYDALAVFRNIHLHKMMGTSGIQERVPGIRDEGLRGGASYYDARMDDARYCMATARAAAREGAHLVTYCEAESISREGNESTVEARDVLGDASIQIKCRAVVIACGPWTDQVRDRLLGKSKKVLAPTKGVHIVVPRERMPLPRSLLMRHPDDGRVVFNIPWGSTATIIGTTDTFYDGDPADAHADRSDVDYILRVANFVFPEAGLVPDDVVATYTGLRPLMLEEGVDEGATSREHAVLEDEGAVFTIAGGKWTTHRRMGKDVVDRVVQRLELDCRPCSTASAPVEDLGTPMVKPGDTRAIQDLARREGLEPDSVRRLALHLGRGMKEAIERMRERPELKEPVVEGQPVLLGEAFAWARHEQALTLTDALDRRTSLALVARGQAVERARAIAEELAPDLGWDGDEVERQVSLYAAHVGRSQAWRDEP